ncbi:MAG: hypothetical protein ACYCXP_06490 [Leptospirillum sp.]
MLKRVKLLERRLRSSSDGTVKISEYGEWIEEAGLPVPTRQTLRLDLERYAAWCDDIAYGGGRKILAIDPHAGKDAIRHFLGEPWIDSPLKPKLSSSACRCFLLAMVLKKEVEFPYTALPREGSPPTYKIHRGVPIRTLPGSDSGYMAVWERSGQVFPINLARSQGRVSFTKQADISSYKTPKIYAEQAILDVQSGDKQATERCLNQFDGGVRKENAILIPVPEIMAVMMADILESWWRRTTTMPRQVERTFSISGKTTTISIHRKENVP